MGIVMRGERRGGFRLVEEEIAVTGKNSIAVCLSNMANVRTPRHQRAVSIAPHKAQLSNHSIHHPGSPLNSPPPSLIQP